jgi:transposase
MGVAPNREAGVIRTKRTRHTAEFTAKIALASLRENATVPEVARQFGVHPNLIYNWTR